MYTCILIYIYIYVYVIRASYTYMFSPASTYICVSKCVHVQIAAWFHGVIAEDVSSMMHCEHTMNQHFNTSPASILIPMSTIHASFAGIRHRYARVLTFQTPTHATHLKFRLPHTH